MLSLNEKREILNSFVELRESEDQFGRFLQGTIGSFAHEKARLADRS
jgi:hypothetical protein